MHVWSKLLDEGRAYGRAQGSGGKVFINKHVDTGEILIDRIVFDDRTNRTTVDIVYNGYKHIYAS